MLHMLRSIQQQLVGVRTPFCSYLTTTLLSIRMLCAKSLSCSLLSLAPDMISLPMGDGGLAATASQADVAAGEAASGEGEQDGAAAGHATRSSRDSITGAATAPKDLLVGHRCVCVRGSVMGG